MTDFSKTALIGILNVTMAYIYWEVISVTMISWGMIFFRCLSVVSACAGFVSLVAAATAMSRDIES